MYGGRAGLTQLVKSARRQQSEGTGRHRKVQEGTGRHRKVYKKT